MKPSSGIEVIRDLAKKGEYKQALEQINSYLEERNKEIFDIKVLQTSILSQSGDHEKALENITELLQDTEMNSNQIFSLVKVKIDTLFNMGKVDEALSLVNLSKEKYLSKDLSHKDQYEIVTSLYSLEGQILLRKGNYESALQVYHDALYLSTEENKEEDMSNFYNNLGIIYRVQGNNDLAAEYFEKSLEISLKINNLPTMSRTYNNIGTVHYFKGDLNKALEYFEKSLEIRKIIGNKQDIAGSLNNIAMIYQSKGETDKALKSLEESLEIYQELGINTIIAKIYNNMGVIRDGKGDLNEALEYFNKALDIYTNLKSEDEKLSALFNKANVFKQQGELVKALESMDKCLEISKTIGNKQDIADSLVNISEINYLGGETKQAEEYLKESLATIKEVGNNLTLSIIYFLLIRILVDLEDIGQAQSILHDYQIIAEKEKDNKIINQSFRVSEALVLKESSRLKDIAKAQTNLVEVINEEVIQQETTVIALLTICEMLINEFYEVKEAEILEELSLYIRKLEEIGEKQNSYWLIAETYWLKAQISLLNLELEEAQLLLQEAQKIADEKGLKKLAIVLSNEHDKILEQLERWEELLEKNASLNERAELIQLEELAKKMIRMGTTTPDLPDEKPILFMIINETGFTLFSKEYVETSSDSILLGGLLTAINNLVSIMFASAGWLERIKHEKYTLIFKKSSNITLCYAFEGQSYLATKKMEAITNQITGNESIVNQLEKSYSLGLDIKKELKEEINYIISEEILKNENR